MVWCGVVGWGGVGWGEVGWGWPGGRGGAGRGTPAEQSVLYQVRTCSMGYHRLD